MDGAVVIGVVAVLTSGVFGPVVLHLTQRRRDDRSDQRAALDNAIEPLAKARAQVAWIQATGFDPGTEHEELDRRLEELVHQTQLLEAHTLKLKVRFDDKLADAYGAAGGAVNQQAATLWERRSGEFAEMEEFEAEMAEAEDVYRASYDQFIESARGWYGDRLLPRGSDGGDDKAVPPSGDGSETQGERQELGPSGTGQLGEAKPGAGASRVERSDA